MVNITHNNVDSRYNNSAEWIEDGITTDAVYVFTNTWHELTRCYYDNCTIRNIKWYNRLGGRTFFKPLNKW